MYHLRGKKGVPSQRVASHLTTVEYKLGMRLTDLPFTEKHNGSVKMALLAAVKKSKGEILATLKKNQRMVKLPAPDELTENALQRLWIEAEGFNDFRGIHKTAVALCIIFMDITGNRSCNLIKCRRHRGSGERRFGRS